MQSKIFTKFPQKAFFKPHETIICLFRNVKRFQKLFWLCSWWDIFAWAYTMKSLWPWHLAPSATDTNFVFARIGHKFSARRTCLETFEIETCVGYLLGQTRRAVVQCQSQRNCKRYRYVTLHSESRGRFKNMLVINVPRCLIKHKQLQEQWSSLWF